MLSGGLEPPLLAPEANALSAELREREADFTIKLGFLRFKGKVKLYPQISPITQIWFKKSAKSACTDRRYACAICGFRPAKNRMLKNMALWD